MTVLEYVVKLTESACFGDDYVATDMAKVRKFEDGMKLSIRGKIVGLLLQDMVKRPNPDFPFLTRGTLPAHLRI